jgi:hypothetical protein
LMTNSLANMRNRSKVVLAPHQVPEQTIERVLVALRVLTALYEIEKQPSHIAVEELLRLAENDEERTDGTGRSRLPRHKARAAQSGRLAGNADSRQHRVRPHEIETCGAISAAQSELTIY